MILNEWFGLLEKEQERQDFKEAIDVLNKADLSSETKERLFGNILFLRKSKLNLLLIGGTGAGKSTTIRTLFDTKKMDRDSIAKLDSELTTSDSAKPQTMKIEPYTVGDNLTIWDSPGLGDGAKDASHIQKIKEKIEETDENGNALIDCALVIIDAGGGRDLESTYKAIATLKASGLEDERILIALNQCDRASRNSADRFENGKPNASLQKVLDEKVATISERIKENCGLNNVEIMYYSAGFYDAKKQKFQNNRYNIDKLLFFITQSAPKGKRFIFKRNATKDEVGKSDDALDYIKETQKSWWESLKDTITSTLPESVKMVIEASKPIIEKVVDVVLDSTPIGKVIKTGKKVFDIVKGWFL